MLMAVFINILLFMLNFIPVLVILSQKYKKIIDSDEGNTKTWLSSCTQIQKALTEL